MKRILPICLCLLLAASLFGGCSASPAPSPSATPGPNGTPGADSGSTNSGNGSGNTNTGDLNSGSTGSGNANSGGAGSGGMNSGDTGSGSTDGGVPPTTTTTPNGALPGTTPGTGSGTQTGAGSTGLGLTIPDFNEDTVVKEADVPEIANAVKDQYKDATIEKIRHATYQGQQVYAVHIKTADNDSHIVYVQPNGQVHPDQNGAGTNQDPKTGSGSGSGSGNGGTGSGSGSMGSGSGN